MQGNSISGAGIDITCQAHGRSQRPYKLEYKQSQLNDNTNEQLISANNIRNAIGFIDVLKSRSLFSLLIMHKTKTRSHM